MAKRAGISRMAVSRIWRAFGLRPHRSETFKLSTDPQLVEKVRDIVGLYLNPPDRAQVLCADEKSQIQALNRMQPVLPMRPGQVERWFALLTQRAIKRGAHTSTSQLERAIRDFIDAHNQEPKPFIWTKPADDILASIARFAAHTGKIHAPT